MAGIIQFSQLGRFGRIGNQLFQYAFAKSYAEKHGAVLETPPWIGQTLFEGINDPPISCELPRLSLDLIPPDGATNIDLIGYYQFKEAFDYYSLSKLRKMFTFKRGWVNQFPRVDRFVAHIRRGDYTTTFKDLYCTVHEDAYLAAMYRAGMNPTRVRWVREDCPHIFPHPDLEWLQDFFTIYNADVVFRANSTFSWWACTLGHAIGVYSPVVEGKRGLCADVKFVKGNHPRCVDLPNVSDFIIKD